jgi:integrase
LGQVNVRNRNFKNVQEHAGLSGFNLYSLRHTHATLLLLAGVHPKIVSERLGLATIAITYDTYSHVLPNMQQEAAEKLEAILYGSKEEEAEEELESGDELLHPVVN